MLRDVGDHIAEVGERFHAMERACAQQGVQQRGMASGAVAACEHVVLTPSNGGHGADGILYLVVVDEVVAILHLGPQPRP